MKRLSIPLLCLLSSVLPSLAQTTVTVNNLNWRTGTGGNNGTGIFGTGWSAGEIVPLPPATNFNSYAAADPGEFNFRWRNLTLDSAGTNDDWIDFTISFTSANPNGGTTGNITFAGDGIGIAGGDGGIDGTEEMTVSVTNISLKPGMLGSVTFDGFSEAGFFGAGSAKNVSERLAGTPSSFGSALFP